MEVKVIGQMDNKMDNTLESANRVYKGDIALAHPANIPDGSYKYIVAMCGRGENNAQTLEPNTSGTTNSLTTVQKDNLVMECPQYKIRKLTPREYWRLMGYTDKDFDKAQGAGVSNSQLYKQAGNAIVKQVLMGIFAQMIPIENRAVVLVDKDGNSQVYK